MTDVPADRFSAGGVVLDGVFFYVDDFYPALKLRVRKLIYDNEFQVYDVYFQLCEVNYSCSTQLLCIASPAAFLRCGASSAWSLASRERSCSCSVGMGTCLLCDWLHIDDSHVTGMKILFAMLII